MGTKLEVYLRSHGIKPVALGRESGYSRNFLLCRVAGKTLVKQLELRAGWIHLISCNPRYGPINVDEDDFQLVGIVIGRLGNVNGVN